MLLRYPLLPALLLPVIAVLFGAGRTMGLPLLFWHEHAGPRFLAGLGSTLLAAEIFFVGYLLGGEGHFPGLGGLILFLCLGGTLWLIAVGAAALVRGLRYRNSRRTAPSGGGSAEPAEPTSDAQMAPQPGVAPAMRAAGPAGSARSATSAGSEGQLQAVQVPVAAFLLGVVLAVAAVAAGLAAARLAGGLIDLRLDRRSPGCPALGDDRLHLVAAAVFALVAIAFWVLRRRATPALGLSMLLALVAATHGAATFWLCSPGLGLLALLALLLLAGRRVYKIRIPAFAQLYRSPRPYPPVATADRPHPDLLPANLLPPEGAPGRQRLIVICTSGGGIRAAAWTAALLGRLDEVPGARKAVRVITGASGGMVGAASWVARLHARGGDPAETAPAGSWEDLLDAVAMNSLTPLARRLVFRDLPLAFAPVDNLHDRGRALEDAWVANLRKRMAIDLDLPLGQLRNGERLGQLPSLVFSPMLVEDGRRLIISNRDLRAVTDSEARWLSSSDSAQPYTGRNSRGAYHLSDLLPDDWARIPLATAARLSASFPYISPAAVLPTLPRRRAVDAGYFDAYGLDLLCNLLREALTDPAPLLARVSGILLLQIRDNVSQLSLNPDHDPPAPEAAPDRAAALLRGLDGFTTPIAGLLAGREAVSLFRSDAQLETLCRLYQGASGNADFLTTTMFEFRGEASLSWYLTEAETEGLRAQAASEGIDSKLQAIARWLRD